MNLPTQHDVQAMRESSRYSGQPKQVTGKHGKVSKPSKPIPLSTGDGEAVMIQPVSAGHARPVPPMPDKAANDMKAKLEAMDKRIASLEAALLAMQGKPGDSQVIVQPATDGQTDRKAYMKAYMAEKRAANKAAKA